MKNFQKGGDKSPKQNMPYFPKPGDKKPKLEKGPYKPGKYPKDMPKKQLLQKGGTNSRTRNVEARQQSRATRQTARQEQRTERARIRANDPRSLKEKIFGDTSKRNTNNYTPQPERTAPLNVERTETIVKPQKRFTPEPEKYKKYMEDPRKAKEFQKGGAKKKPNEALSKIVKRATTQPKALIDMGKKIVKKVRGYQDGGTTRVPDRPGYFRVGNEMKVVKGGTEKQRNKYVKKTVKGYKKGPFKPNKKAEKYAERKGLKTETVKMKWRPNPNYSK